MLKLSFIDVGQGDSIILEWQNGIAIIDSNLYQAKNPVLIALSKKTSIKKIDYIVLSHPHTDHFSGIRDILEYCETNKIIISNFLFTGRISIEYINDSVFGNDARKELSLLFEKMKELYNRGIILNITNVSSSVKFDLNNDLSMEFLAPNYSEVEEYEKNTVKKILNKINNPKANNISSIIKLGYKDKYILLTSDAPKFVFPKILKRRADLKNKTLILGQIPHHGSKKNFNNNFWDKSLKINETIAAISVGIGYDHPDEFVIKELNNYNYHIYSTNFVGGLVKYYGGYSRIKTSTDLDDFSILKSVHSPALTPQFNGDQVFNFDSNLNLI